MLKKKPVETGSSGHCKNDVVLLVRSRSPGHASQPHYGTWVETVIREDEQGNKKRTPIGTKSNF